MSYIPYLAGIVGVCVLLVAYKLTTKDSFARLYEGADGRASTSKFQFFLWTVVVIFSYIALYTVKLAQKKFDPISSLPDNVLIAIGMSVVTATTAKAVTVSYIATNRIAKSQSMGGGSFGDLFQDDSGVPDLSKMQMIAWTFIAIATYLVLVGHQIATGKAEIPDIDKSLMALMGLGQAAYLGKKAVDQNTQPTGSTVPPAPQSANGSSVNVGQSTPAGQGSKK